MNDADKCRANGWTVGTKLEGTEGSGTDTIRITAVGETGILARRIIGKNRKPVNEMERNWSIGFRDWKEVK